MTYRLLVYSWWGLVATTAAATASADDAARPPASAAADDFDHVLRPFLAQHCVRCHGDKNPKGERSLSQLAPSLVDDDALVDWQDVLDQLYLGEMPPADQPQPADADRRRVIAWLSGRIAEYHAAHRPTGQGVVLRRLNAREYRNTIRDLLQLDVTMFDPTAPFPRDQLHEHLDNVGASLVTSGHLLNRYLDAAETVVEKALYPLQRPEERTWTFRDNFRQQPEIDQVHGRTNDFGWLTLYDVIGADKHEGAYAPLLAFREGAPVDGAYELRVRARAVNRQHPYEADWLGLDPSEPLRLGVVAGSAAAGPLHKPQPIEPLLAEFELRDEEGWYTTEIRLDRGFSPRFTFPNGLMDARSLWSRLLKRYPDQFSKRRSGGIVEARYTAIKEGKLPQIHVYEVELRGPLVKEWPTAAQRALLGADAEAVLSSQQMTPEQMRRQLARFAARAYRRPLTEDELQRLTAFAESQISGGASSLTAYEHAVQSVLCSPAFLYLDEPDESGRLTPHALASRLSYCLWSSCPDAALTALADSGRLTEPDVLAAEIDRLLADPRSDAFIDGFLQSWLTLRDFGSMPPDRETFSDYYHYDLGTAMRRETQLFTRCLLDENRSVVEFLDADFTFVNRPLARHYGLEPPPGPGFARVALSDARRGGLLGQASVLTVTANGIDTSPVVRGVWLLENMLGTPPSPPPPDVEPLDPDVRGATSIRDQLQKHRSTASCYDCHRKIDPLGFALENFDPIGGWRTRYESDTPIDSAGELPGGQKFDDVVGLKRVLVEEQELFIRALTTRLLAYALGRPIEPADRPHVDRITAELAARGNGFRDLVRLVVLSEPFGRP